jgi:MFS transporter, putative metabolite:H+ symporter
MATTEASQIVRSSAASRVNHPPIAVLQRRTAWLLAFVFFFEFGDINTFSFAAPAILKAWGLTIPTMSLIMSATFIGMFVGGTTGGWISDRIGRKKALILATVWFSGFSLLNAFVWEPVGLFTTRLLTGIGLSAMTVVGITYISEIFPADRVGAYQAWILAAGLVGIPATAYLARFCIPVAPWGWRLVFLWGAIGLTFPFFAGRLEESPHWHEFRERSARADGARQHLDSGSGALAPPWTADQSAERPRIAAIHAKPVAEPPYFRRTLMLATIWTCQTLGFYGFMSWVPTLLVAHGISLVQTLAWSSIIQLGAVPGALIGAMISDRWQRKWWIAIASATIAVCGVNYGLTDRTDVVVIFGFLVVMFLHTFAALLYSYTAECYPTEIRNLGTGSTYGIGRLANVFGPLVIAYLYIHHGYASVFFYIGACWVIVGVVIVFLGPATRNRTLA